MNKNREINNKVYELYIIYLWLAPFEMASIDYIW